MIRKSTFTILIVLICVVASLEVTQDRRDIINFDIPVDNNNNNGGRRERSVSLFGRYVNMVMSRIIPWQKRIPVLNGARFVSKRENIKYWEKPGGKSAYEKDLALIVRKKAENRPNVEPLISKGTTHNVYRLRLESINIKGEWSTDVITYF